MPRTYQIGETERIDLGQGYVVEKRHTDVGIDVDVRHLGVSIKTMRYAADLRRLTIDIVLLLLRQRDEARERMHADRLTATRPVQSKPLPSPPGISGAPAGSGDFVFGLVAVLLAFFLGLIAGAHFF